MRIALVSIAAIAAGLAATSGFAQITETPPAAPTAPPAAAPAAAPQDGGPGFGRGPGGPGFDGRGPGGPGFDGRGPGGPGFDGRGPGGPDFDGRGGGDGRGPGGPDGRGPDGRGPGGDGRGPGPDGPPAPPPIPTTGDGAALLSQLTNVCDKVLLQKQRLDTVARAAGLTRVRPDPRGALIDGGWRGPFGQGGTITYAIQSPTNQATVCEIEIDTGPDSAQVLVDALDAWSLRHTPEMRRTRNDVATTATGASLRRFTWLGFTDNQIVSLAYNKVNNPDGSSANPRGDRSRIYYSLRNR